MKITKKEIEDMFENLINHNMSREDCSDYANKLMQAFDNYQLEFEPRKDEDKIWEGITYLSGVDLKNADGSYLHIDKDFIHFLEFIKNDNFIDFLDFMEKKYNFRLRF